eukprot:477679_1
MRSLTLTRETSNHFYDMRVATNQKYQEIIEKNQLQPILKRLTSQNIELFSKKYDYNQCDRDFKHCDAVTRIIKILSYYDRLNIASNEQYQDKFIKLMSIYKQFVDDFIHLHNNHCDELKHMNEELIECKITTCDFTSRHHGSVATINDNKLRFYVQLMDTLHFYLYHCFHAGIRSKTEDDTQDENDEKHAAEYFDEVFNRIKQFVQERKHITQAFDRFSTKNKKFSFEAEELVNLYLDELLLYLTETNINPNDIRQFERFLRDEEYDTETLKYYFDINDPYLYDYVCKPVSDCVQSFMKAARISSSSF